MNDAMEKDEKNVEFVNNRHVKQNKNKKKRKTKNSTQ